MAETTTSIRQIGPESDGTRMTLDEFAPVKGRPGYIYELEKGVVVVVDAPGVPHAYIKQAIRDALFGYRLAHPERISLVAETSDAALRMPDMRGDRCRKQKFDASGVLTASMLPGFELKLADVFSRSR